MGNKRKWYSILLVGLILLLTSSVIGCAPAPATAPPDITIPPPSFEPPDIIIPEPEPQFEPVEAEVIRVIDGDTIEVEIDGSSYRVRYIGIDTPEVGQPCADEATEKNRELVEGKVVWLEKDVSETDRYGRLLRYVYVDDTFVNDELVRLGYAVVSTYPPDVAHEDDFVTAEFMARIVNVVGIWQLSCFARHESPEYGYTIEYPQVWEIGCDDTDRVILSAERGYSFITIYVSHVDISVSEMADAYPEYLAEVMIDEWNDFEVTYSNELTGKWDWIIGFAYTDILGPEPLLGIGEVYIVQVPDYYTFVVQWDGSEVLSEECKRIVETFDFSSPPRAPPEETGYTGVYVGSVNSDVYHYPWCHYVDRIKSYNEIWFTSATDAKAHGYRPCKVCKPPG